MFFRIELNSAFQFFNRARGEEKEISRKKYSQTPRRRIKFKESEYSLEDPEIHFAVPLF